MIRRKRHKKIPLQGNVYPFPTAAYIEDPYLRMTLLTGQPLGASSLDSGELEVVLTRIQDVYFVIYSTGLFDSIPILGYFGSTIDAR